jgi:glycerophosphoryl diester phosphodiesterase
MLTACHDAGMVLTTWTCNDAERMSQLASIGVDGVCTDVPDVALAALGRTDADAAPRWPLRS